MIYLDIYESAQKGLSIISGQSHTEKALRAIRTRIANTIIQRLSIFSLLINRPKDYNADSRLKVGRIQGRPRGHNVVQANVNEAPCFAFLIHLFGLACALLLGFAHIVAHLHYGLRNQSEILKKKLAQQLAGNKRDSMTDNQNFRMNQSNNLQINCNLQKLREELGRNNVSFSLLSRELDVFYKVA